MATSRSNPFSPIARLGVALLFCLGILMDGRSAGAADSTPQATGADMLASFDGLERAIARQYESQEGSKATPSTAPTITSAYIFIFRFDTDANANQVQELISSIPLVQDSSALTTTSLPEFGDEATLLLSADASATAPAEGMLFVRDGSTAIIVSGEGEGPSAALGKRLQELASFVLAHPASPEPITVTYGGEGSGGDFARLPGVGDTEVLQGMLPRWDYDLLAEITPVDPTATPKPPCSCAPPGTVPA